MDWAQKALAALGSMRHWGYHREGSSAAEPLALVAIALLQHERIDDAKRALAWLDHRQAADGSVGVTQSQADPAWTTALALLAWVHAQNTLGENYEARIQRAANWLLAMKGNPLARSEQLGHDSTLIGWPWVQGTHSWLEPTAWSVVALKAAGYDAHARVREAVKLIYDRLLPAGGCNYGNTFVLGQQLRPHLQPSGVALLALAGERDDSGRLERTIAYVRREISAEMTTSSLCHALLGLTAHGQWPERADEFLRDATRRTLERDPGAYKLALLLLAQTRISLLPRKQVVVS